MPDPTTAAYDAAAEDYEARFLHELDGKPRDRDWLGRLDESCGDGPLLDVGCGPGQIGAFLRARGRTVVGVDLSEAMTRLARRRLDGAVQADLRRLPVPDARMAGIAAFYSLIHVPPSDRLAAFAELRRVLAPGGHVLVTAQEGEGTITRTELLGHAVEVTASFWTLDDLVGTARGAGLEVARAERYEPYDVEGFPRLFVDALR